MARSGRVLVLLLVAGLVGVYWYFTNGGMTARARPMGWEAGVARWLLTASVPRAARERKNPLTSDANSAHLDAGQALYKQKCEVCHAHDGGGHTETSGGQYPPPPDLRSVDVQKLTDGELFYFIRNGIRNTAMPGWYLSDQQTWQLVAYVRALPKGVQRTEATLQTADGGYTGSAACRRN